MHSDVYFAIGLLVGLVFTMAIVAIVACLPGVRQKEAKESSSSNSAEPASDTGGGPANDNAPADESTSSYAPALSRIATNVWRMEKRIADSGSVASEVDTNRIRRHLEATIESLGDVGVEIHDLHGRRYDPGMALKVIAFEPTLGLSYDQIIESVKPSITWNERLIQIGEVIVGTPGTELEGTGEQ